MYLFIKMRFLLSIIFFSLCSLIFAQNDFEKFRNRANSNFENFKKQKQEDLKEYLERINSEYSEFMRKAWPEYQSLPAIPSLPKPEPPKPVVVDPQREITNDPIPFSEIIPLSIVPSKPQPLVPVPKPSEIDDPIKEKPISPKPKKNSFKFNFYGDNYEIPVINLDGFKLKDVSESSVADGWYFLTHQNNLELIGYCIDYRDKLNLNDWGYFRFLEKMTSQLLPDKQNEARLLQMFILAQSGYKVRIGRQNGKLILLLPSSSIIYKYPYLMIDGMKFYNTDTTNGNSPINIFNHQFPQEQSFSLYLSGLPQLAENMTSEKYYQSKQNDYVSAYISVNKNLIDFMNDYPITSQWDIYSRASLSTEVKSQLYGPLKAAISGKNITDAANILLQFVQTAFEYKTDGDQFGYERPFFADESLYYPYNDCEDRAIFYSILVKDLLNLDVVLLHYPEHLATAVYFPENVSGDYVEVDGKRYIVCDPTYINSRVGECMPQYKHTSVKIVKI